MNDPVHIVYCLDKNYQQHFGASVTSLLENYRDDFSDIRIYIITDVYENDFQLKIDEIKKKYTVSMDLIAMDESNRLILQGVHQQLPNQQYISYASWFRLCIANLVPENVEKALYLDADTIILSSIKELYQIDLHGHPVGGVEDFSSRMMCQQLKIKQYINTGVMLLDLKQWRAHNLIAGCIEASKKNIEKIRYGDQCAINLFLSDKILLLPRHWNQFITPNRPTKNMGEGILHFITKDKPWQSWYDHTLANLYWKYIGLSPWSNRLPDPPKNIQEAHQLAWLKVKNQKFKESIKVYQSIIKALQSKLDP